MYYFIFIKVVLFGLIKFQASKEADARNEQGPSTSGMQVDEPAQKRAKMTWITY